MEKTIQMMKESGLFDSLVKNILTKNMPKEAVAVALDTICEMDENFEDTFFNDIHTIGLNIIWKELCSEVAKRKGEDLKKMVLAKCECMIDDIFADVMKNNK